MSGTSAILPIDPELVTALAAVPRAGNGKLMDLTDVPALQELIRVRTETAAAQVAPDPHVSFSTCRPTRDDGTELDLRIARPADVTGPLPALAYFHAGGQVVGEGANGDLNLGTLALALNCAVVGVDYRVAPQTQAPGAADDGFVAYAYLVERAGELGIDSARIGIAAASGGAAPATATVLMLRDRGLQPPRLLSLNYPMLDDRNETASAREIPDIGIWDRQENELAWKAVLGDRVGMLDLSPYCAPARTTDLRDMPRTFIAVGQFDILRDESIDFALRLLAAGVPVDLHVYGTAYHAFDVLAPTAQITGEFIRTWHAFLRRELHN